jgi:hypothetical protein
MLGDTVVPGNIPGNPGIEGDKPTMPGGLKSWGRRQHWATGEGGALSTDETYHPESGALIPEGNWHGFQDSVDQGAESKVDDAFAPGEHDKHYDGDPSNTDFVSGRESRRRRQAADPSVDPNSAVGALGDMAMPGGTSNYSPPSNSATPTDTGAPGTGGVPDAMHETPEVPDAMHMGGLTLRYLSFCRRNNLGPTLASLERHGERLDPGQYLVLASALDKLARLPQSEKVKVARVVEWTLRQANSRQRTAAPDYLMKAKDALEGLLNQKAEEFQTGVAPLQQALQVVQQSQAIEQANNPLSVQPPAGTVNVLPDPPQGMPGAPAAGGGAPAADQNAPPPAADAAGLSGGMPPDPTQQMAAGRRRGGHPKGRVPA